MRISVHPRGCGEHTPEIDLERELPGSSPRARGTHYAALTKKAEERFIPAGAGNTTRTRTAARSNSVHPRGRREHDYHPGKAVWGGLAELDGKAGLFEPLDNLPGPAQYKREADLAAIPDAELPLIRNERLMVVNRKAPGAPQKTLTISRSSKNAMERMQY